MPSKLTLTPNQGTFNLTKALFGSLVLGTVSTVLMASLPGSAFAASIAACAPDECAPSVHVIPGNAPHYDAMTIRNTPPMGHLHSVDFQRSPDVSITRVYGMPATTQLSDAPSAFNGKCHPTSAEYCRMDMNGVAPIPQPAPQPQYMPAPVMQAPVMPAPVMQAPVMQAPVMQAPVMQAPVMQAPVVQAPVAAAPTYPRTVYVGGGYDASKFTPRVYGDTSFVPGIAYIPTSTVNRSQADGQAVLDANGIVGRVPAPNQGQALAQPQMQNMPATGPTAMRPVNQMHPQMAQQAPQNGAYWEQVSGPTTVGNVPATKVICRRPAPAAPAPVQAPVQTYQPAPIQYRVVRPVIPVPYPVPGC